MENKEVEADSGITAIVRAFMSNPGGAIQIVAFILSLGGLYWAIQGEISEVRAAQNENSIKFTAKLDRLEAQVSDAGAKIDALYTRGDTRYMTIISKLSSHDVDIAEIKTGVNFIVKQYDRNKGMEMNH